jgi:hypothetical protein
MPRSTSYGVSFSDGSIIGHDGETVAEPDDVREAEVIEKTDSRRPDPALVENEEPRPRTARKPR